MTQHTPGRLFVLPKHPDTFHAETPGGRGLRVGEASSCRTKAEDYANARRLVAAWNALDGIPTTDIEAAARSGSIAYALSKVITQRDELLAALNLLKAWDFGAAVVTAEDEKLMDGVAAFARAAIAKAEGGEA